MQTTPELATSKLTQIYLCSAETHAGKIKGPKAERTLSHLAETLRPVVSGKEKKHTPQDTTSAFPGQSRSLPQMYFQALPQREETLPTNLKKDCTNKHASVGDAEMP